MKSADHTGAGCNAPDCAKSMCDGTDCVGASSGIILVGIADLANQRQQRALDLLTQQFLEQVDGSALLSVREARIVALLNSEPDKVIAVAALIKAYAIVTGDGPKVA